MYRVPVQSPPLLDGEVLRDELLAAGIPVNAGIGAINVDGDSLTIAIDVAPTLDLVEKVAGVVAAHTGASKTKQTERSRNEKRKHLSNPVFAWLLGEINTLRTHLKMRPYTIADVLNDLEK